MSIDVAEIIKSIENDPLLKHTNDTNHDTLLLGDNVSLETRKQQIMQQDQQLSNNLNNLNLLTTWRDLIMEFNTNLQLFELENCYYSLQNLHRKINENVNCFQTESLQFQRSVMKYVDQLHVSYINEIFKILTENFWNVKNNSSYKNSTSSTQNPSSIQFVNDIEFENEFGTFCFQYDSFMAMIKSLLFQDKQIENWLIDSMQIGDAKEIVRRKINNIENDYIDLFQIIELFKINLFNDSVSFEISNENTLSFIDGSKKLNCDQLLNKFSILIQFCDDILSKKDLVVILEKLGPIVNTELLKTIKNNAKLILQKDDDNGITEDNLKTKIIKISENLKKLSKKITSNWSYDAKEIENLLNDKQLYQNLLMDQIFNDTIKFLRNSMETIDIKTNKEIIVLSSQIENMDENKDTTDGNDDNDWDWDDNDAQKNKTELSTDNQDEILNNENDGNNELVEEDDAWNDEIDIDLNDLNDDANPTNANQTDYTKKQEYDEEDAWDEEWNLDDDVANEDISNKKISESSSAKIEVTTLPRLFLDIYQQFQNTCETQIDKSTFDQHYCNYKSNLLQTTFFAMAQLEYQMDWIQLYIDMTYLHQLNNKLIMIQQLAQRHLQTNISFHLKKIRQLINSQLIEFHRNEDDPTWDITLNQILPLIQDEIIVKLSALPNEESGPAVIYCLNNIYNKFISDVILKWNIISAKNSEHLGELVQLIYNKTNISFLQNDKRYMELRDKFQLMGKFLPMHLKEIMELFYDGEFYLYDTEEIVNWIRLLFADTELRQDAIDDIHEIREVSQDI